MENKLNSIECSKEDKDIMDAEFPIVAKSQDDIYEVAQMKKQGYIEVKPWVWKKKKQ